MSSSPLSLPIDHEPITCPRVILCEGSGDKAFFQQLIKARELPEFYITHPIEQLHPGGRDGFEQRLRSLRVQPGFERVIGILVVSDNDSNPDASFQAVRKLVHQAEYKVANRPLMIALGPPALAVIMMPDSGKNGQLETLCLEAIRDKWPDHFRCVEKLAECTGIAAWTQNKQEKAKLRALISHICKKDPNSSLTYLWNEGREMVIPVTHDCFTPIATFLGGFEAAIAALPH